MDFAANERSAELIAQAREFLRRELTPDVRERAYGPAGDWFDPQFHAALAREGWIGAYWPAEYGGRGWPRTDYDLIYDQLASAGAPLEMTAVTMIVAETIRRAGPAHLKERLLKPVTRGEILFALGYTEPGSGSDLASVNTRAVRDGDGWVISGQKIFTTGGHLADYIFLLARTDPDVPKHEGLTLFLVPTSSAGFSAAPIYTLSGQRTNVTYYADIRIGDDLRICEPGQGWETINIALAFERGAEFAAQLRRLVTAAAAWGRAAGKQEDPKFLVRLGRAVANAEVSRLLGEQSCWLRSSERAAPVEGAMSKIYATESFIRDSGALLDTAGVQGLLNPGHAGAPAGGELQQLYRESQISTLYGGTSEVLRGVVAQGRLKLPRARARQ
jgi:alkylation response protein AidB-like acyl-CoA dehydrogenase